MSSAGRKKTGTTTPPSEFVRAVVCLGNPGTRYAGTRHNLGFRVGDRLAGGSAGRWTVASAYLHTTRQFGEHQLLLVKPTDYVNDSGRAVVMVMETFEVAPPDLMVVLDDVHLELGRLRVRRTGSDGGHNGLRSIIGSVGSTDFPRLRLGIGMPPEGEDLIDFVLGKFTPQEEVIVDELLRTAATAVHCWVTQGMDATMNGYNSA